MYIFTIKDCNLVLYAKNLYFLYIILYIIYKDCNLVIIALFSMYVYVYVNVMK